MPQLSIYLLGPPRVELDEQPIEVDTRKAIALLAYLAGQPESRQMRDGLAALFWPEVDQARALAALRRTLSTLNKATGGLGLEIDREAVAFVRGPQVWLDLDEFNARLAACGTHGHAASQTCPDCLPLLAEAAALYRDDFLAGFSLRDSPGFDDWQFFQAEALRRTLGIVLERLVSGHARRGEYEAAIHHARRWLALDPLHEPAHRQLMQLYAWNNQRAAALRQYRECVRVLENELGVAPLEETTALYEAIKENRGPLPPGQAQAASPPALVPAAPVPLPGPAADYPLVGRTREWDALLAAYQAARQDGRLVVLEGEAGIGKTRLAEALLQYAREHGGRGLVARCYEGEIGLAYGPLAEALRGALGAGPAPVWLDSLAPHWLSEAARLLPELRSLRLDLPPPSPVESPGAHSRLLEGVRQVLLAALRGRPAADPARPAAPGLLLVDDAHWIDEASLDLLTYLVRRLRGQPLLLLVTWRGEQVPAGHRLRQLLAEAQRAGTGSLLPLGRLSLAAVDELVQATVPSEAAARRDQSFVQRLYQETEGLPFFVVEYLASLAQAAEGAEWHLPGGVRGLLDARLAAVGETEHQLLHTAAVIGRSFDFDTLHAASGRSEEETIAGLEALMAAGIVGEVAAPDNAASGPAYDFSHEKLRALVYDQASLARRRLLHRRVAEALAARARRHGGAALGALAGQIAQHFQLAGHEAEAAEYYRLAGEHARQLFANAEAMAHFRSALALGHPATALLHEAIGDLHTLSGVYDLALASYETAAALAAPGNLAGLEHKLGNVYQRRGDWDLAETHFQAALNGPGPDLSAEQRARVYADWSLTAHLRGEGDRAQALASQALELAEAAGDRRALAQAHNLLGILASSRAEVQLAQRHLERSLQLAEELNDPAARVAALNNLALAHRHSGQPEPALRLAEQALALATAQGDRHREAALHSNLADLLYALGRAEAAMEHLKQSATIYAEIGSQAGTLQPEIWKLMEW